MCWEGKEDWKQEMEEKKKIDKVAANVAWIDIDTKTATFLKIHSFNFEGKALIFLFILVQYPDPVWALLTHVLISHLERERWEDLINNLYTRTPIQCVLSQ